MDSGAKQLAGRWAVRRTAGGERLEQQDGAARGGSHVAISGAQAGLTDDAWEEFFLFCIHWWKELQRRATQWRTSWPPWELAQEQAFGSGDGQSEACARLRPARTAEVTRESLRSEVSGPLGESPLAI